MKLKPLVASMLLASVGGAYVGSAYAGDAVFYITEDGEAVSDIAVTIDGKKKLVKKNGFVSFDIAQGEHNAELSQYGEWVGDVSFSTSSDAENAEVAVEIIAGEAMADVQVYAPGSEDAQAVGQFAGILSSEETAGPVSGARISVKGTEISTTTNDDGAFVLEMPRGEYDLTVAHPNYGNRDLRGLYILSGAATRVDLTLSMSGDGLIEEVVAVGSYVPQTTTASERDASTVLDAIGAEQFSRFGDSNAASAVKRVAGVSVAEGKYVVVRGLGARHSSIMFNGASLPSPDPTRRVVPLDIFPSSILTNVEIQKAFTPDVFADSTGATVRLNTKSFPDEFEGKVSVSLGYSDGTTGESRDLQNSESMDFLGFGTTGDRELPGAIDGNKAALASRPGTFITEQERIEATKSLPQTMALKKQSITPNMGIEVSAGDTFYNEGDMALGYSTSFKYKNKWKSELDGHRNTYDAANNGLVEDDDYDYIRTINDIDFGVAFTLGMAVGEHEINSNTMWLRKTTAVTEQIDGLRVGDQDQAMKSVQTNWFERQFLIQQFEGESFFDAINSSLMWQASISQASLDEPDSRSYAFSADPNSLVAGALVYSIEPSSLKREYTEQTDDNVDISAGLDTLVFTNDSIEARLKYGFSSFSRERETEVTRTSYVINQSDLNQFTGETDIDKVINDQTVNNGTFQISTANTTGSDQYDATWDLSSVYLMANIDWFDVMSFELGARAEDSSMEVNTNGFGDPTAAITANVDDDDIFAALNTTVHINEDMQLRAGFTQTKNRPDFRELAESFYVDPVSGDKFQGFRDLESSDVDNFDLRLEYYFSESESISLAYFMKDFSAPIEKTLATKGQVFTYRNGNEGSASGIELDFRKEFDLGGYGLFLSGNIADLDSEVEIVADTRLRKQAMQGQADMLANLQFGIDDYERGLEYTFVYAYEGESIYSIAQRDKPNVMKEARSDLGFNAAYSFAENHKFKLKISNILDQEYELTQGGKSYRTYTTGTDFDVSYSYEF